MVAVAPIILPYYSNVIITNARNNVAKQIYSASNDFQRSAKIPHINELNMLNKEKKSIG